MFGGVDPRQMAGMMKKMGIAQEQLPVKRVVFEMEDGNLVIEEPGVMKIKMQGQTSFQVTGEAVESASDDPEEPEDLFSEEDIAMVMEKTEKDRDEVVLALVNSEGDIAGAIMGLKE
ncbi:Nascent polypeptide-associated complex protein [archaeon]|jgi:alpha-NAC-related protein|nr:Nascent polypeptide-associated complex protein [archaeon]